MNSLLEKIKKLNLTDHYLNDYAKTALTETIDQIIELQKQSTNPIQIQSYFIKNFQKSESIGWALENSDKILSLWFLIGNSLKINDVEQKLNHFRPTPSKEDKIQKLLALKKNKKINAEMPDYPIFYAEMKRKMDLAIDNVIAQLKISNKIDEMLFIFHRDIDTFLCLQEREFTFGDTEDRETIGDFYTIIREILNFESTRGVINEKLDFF
jgi:hypothetical protein